MNIPDAKTAAKMYWTLLEMEANAHITTSHHFLRAINQQFGEAAIDAELAPLIEAERAELARREAAFVARERAKLLN